MRFPRSRVVVPLNEPMMGRRGTDQTGADGRVSGVQRSALADALPSDADSITEKVLASPNGPYDKKTRA